MWGQGIHNRYGKNLCYPVIDSRDCLLYTSNPVVGILLSALLLSEEITMAKVGGMLLILVSVFVIQREDWLSGLLTRRVKRIAD